MMIYIFYGNDVNNDIFDGNVGNVVNIEIFNDGAASDDIFDGKGVNGGNTQLAKNICRYVYTMINIYRFALLQSGCLHMLLLTFSSMLI